MSLNIKKNFLLEKNKKYEKILCVFFSVSRFAVAEVSAIGKFSAVVSNSFIGFN